MSSEKLLGKQQQQTLGGRENLISRVATQYYLKCLVFNNKVWNMQRNKKL